MLISVLNGEISQDEYLAFNNAKIIKKPLPKRVYGFTFNYKNNNFILINSYISIEKQKRTILHEFAHLELNHFDKIKLNFKIEGIEDEADAYVDCLLKNI